MIRDRLFFSLNPWFHCLSGYTSDCDTLRTDSRHNPWRSLVFGLPASSKVRKSPKRFSRTLGDQGSLMCRPKALISLPFWLHFRPQHAENGHSTQPQEKPGFRTSGIIKSAGEPFLDDHFQNGHLADLSPGHGHSARVK